MASSTPRKRPPSEKESGVTFTTPISRGFVRSKKNLPAFRPGDLFVEDALRCRRRRFFALRAAAGGRLAGLRGGRLGAARRLPRHDVADLLGVERLPLEERLRHHLDLVAVFFQEP